MSEKKSKNFYFFSDHLSSYFVWDEGHIKWWACLVKRIPTADHYYHPYFLPKISINPSSLINHQNSIPQHPDKRRKPQKRENPDKALVSFSFTSSLFNPKDIAWRLLVLKCTWTGTGRSCRKRLIVGVVFRESVWIWWRNREQGSTSWGVALPC